MSGPRIDEGNIIKKTHFYVLDDKDHDMLFVQHCFMKHWQWLSNQGIRPAQHWVWLNGCIGQFKGSRAIYFVCTYPRFTDGCKMNWSFFGTRHEKGEWDGL
jgi:hypothetical protein